MRTLEENTKNVDFYSCIDKKKYTDTFKDVKEGDTLYFVSFDGNIEFEEKISDSIFGSLNNIVIKENKNYNVVPSFTIEEHKVKEKTYPGLVKHHYNYMKMCGDRPCGVGTSSGFAPLTISLLLVTAKLSAVNPEINSLSEVCHKAGGTNLDNVFKAMFPIWPLVLI